MIEIKNGIPVKSLPSNEVIVALYQIDGVIGWLLSGVLYRNVEEAAENLAAFKPINIKCFRLDLG